MGVRFVEVDEFAHMTSCGMHKSPFKCLGIHISKNMAHGKASEIIVNNFNSRLDKLNINVLSIGGMLFLLKSVPNYLRIYFFYF